MNKLMCRFVATRKKQKMRPVFRHGMPFRASHVTRCPYWHLREMHLFQLYASQIYIKTILANGIV